MVLKAGLAYVRSYQNLLEVAFLGVFLLLCYLLPNHIVDKHERPIPYQVVQDQTLIDMTFGNDYHHNETIPGSLLNLICVVFPMCVFGLGILFGPLGDYHAALCSYLLAMGSKIFIVACLKNYAGYLRPNFYSMCQFQPDKFVCDDETTSARESFPSGHAATALSSMTLLALFLLGKVRGATRHRGLSAAVAHANSIHADHNIHDDCIVWTPSFISKVLAVLAVSPVCLGMFIATSRVRDNWHHPADVVGGGIIGACCALFAHRLWYPSVYSHYAGIPLATVKDILTGRRSEAKAAALRLDLGIESEV
jgi:membrane-associated phospholipid phosphatase